VATWEETKRASQTAFINQESNIQAAHESVDRFYRQILSTGHVHPSIDTESLTRQIADNHFREPEHSQDDLFRSRQLREPEPERGIGLER
jgi:hypothetical protein